MAKKSTLSAAAVCMLKCLRLSTCGWVCSNSRAYSAGTPDGEKNSLTNYLDKLCMQHRGMFSYMKTPFHRTVQQITAPASVALHLLW